MNYRTQSTKGFSIGTALYDFTGGLLSVAQQMLDGILMQDFSAITGAPVKFGLGFISLFYDIIFMVQHFVLYPANKAGELQPELSEHPGLASLADSIFLSENTQYACCSRHSI